MVSITNEEILNRCELVHGNRYDYSKMFYTNNRTKIQIICREHGSFMQSPSHHINGVNCPKCGLETCKAKQRDSKETFVKKCVKVHGEKYNYIKSDYINQKTKVIIICSIHGEFLQTPSDHLTGCGCPKCGKEISDNYIRVNLRSTTEKFIAKAKAKFGNTYKYSLVDYFNVETKVKIICPEGHIFEQIPHEHLRGTGCGQCHYITTDIFIDRCNKIFNFKYNYSKSIYTTSYGIVIIICPNHGEFEQRGISHLRGQGCRKCRSSKGESKIDLYLKTNNINYNSQHKFPNCRNIYPLSFDFYLPDYNLLIEYDGELHYIDNNWNALEGQRFRDNIKNNYCIENNIELLRIPYWDLNKVEEILSCRLNLQEMNL